MKPAKAILALLAIVGTASTASAANVLHITGSTAYRARTNYAILHSFDAGTVNVVATSSPLGKSGVSLFHGTVGGVDTIVETSFTGSVGGIKAVTSNANVPFLPDNADTAGGAYVNNAVTTPDTHSASSELTVTTTAGGNNTNSVPAEVTMADTYQSATLYKTPVLTGATISGGAPEIVGIIPFVWLRSPSADTGVSSITNLNPQLINLLYGNGSLPASLFTGNSADVNSLIYAAGRDPDSGTRLTAFAESGLGANATVVQYRPTGGSAGSGTNGTAVGGLSNAGSVTSVEVWPTTTVANLGQSFSGGNAGESSGGTLVGYVSKAFATGTPGALIAYSSSDDAKSAIQAGAQLLSYNGSSLASQPALGTAPTYDFTQITNGKYTFWGYEHMLYTSGTLPALKTLANKIATQIFTTEAIITVGAMNVSRPGDGGQVGPK